MELPGVIGAARSASRELGTADLVTHIEGDIRHTSLERDYSVVFIGNLIHHMQLEELPGLFEKVRDNLLPGGTIAIWDMADNGDTGDLVVSLFSLFFYLVSAGSCHSQRHIQTALQEAGFEDFQAVRPEGPILLSLSSARKPKT